MPHLKRSLDKREQVRGGGGPGVGGRGRAGSGEDNQDSKSNHIGDGDGTVSLSLEQIVVCDRCLCKTRAWGGSSGKLSDNQALFKAALSENRMAYFSRK